MRFLFTVCAIVSLAGLGCQPCTPAQQARLDLFECRVKALEPLVGPTLDAAELVRDIYLGRADLGQVLATLKASQAEAKALAERFHACEPAPEAPAEEVQTRLVAPPPAYGNKVL